MHCLGLKMESRRAGTVTTSLVQLETPQRVGLCRVLGAEAVSCAPGAPQVLLGAGCSCPGCSGRMSW